MKTFSHWQKLNLTPIDPGGVDLRLAAMNMVKAYQSIPSVERDDFIAHLIPGSGNPAPATDQGAHLRGFLAIFEASGPPEFRPSPSQVLAGIETFMRATDEERRCATVLSRMVVSMWIKEAEGVED